MANALLETLLPKTLDMFKVILNTPDTVTRDENRTPNTFYIEKVTLFPTMHKAVQKQIEIAIF